MGWGHTHNSWKWLERQKMKSMYFKTENWKLLRGDYVVSISSRGISHFQNTDIPVEYWIALEPDMVHNF